MQKKMHVPENFLRGIQYAGLFNRRKWDVKNQCSRRVRVILADADNRKFSIKQGIRLQKRHAERIADRLSRRPRHGGRTPVRLPAHRRTRTP